MARRSTSAGSSPAIREVPELSPRVVDEAELRSVRREPLVRARPVAADAVEIDREPALMVREPGASRARRAVLVPEPLLLLHRPKAALRVQRDPVFRCSRLHLEEALRRVGAQRLPASDR